MYITVETATTRIKRKIVNFQIAGDEIHVNYKIGYTKIEKMTGSTVSTTYKATIQSDIVKLRTAIHVTIVRNNEVLYLYEKIKGIKK